MKLTSLILAFTLCSFCNISFATIAPSRKPTRAPSKKPTTRAPSNKPTTRAPSKKPTRAPSKKPVVTITPSNKPVVTITPSNKPVVTISPTKKPVTITPTILPILNIITDGQFTQLVGVTYTAMANPDSRVIATLAECQSGCSLNCDFYSYNSVSKMCSYQTTDKSTLYSTAFKASATTAVYFYGEITGLAPISSPATANQKACVDSCLSSLTCKLLLEILVTLIILIITGQFAVINQNGGTVKCNLYQFAKQTGSTIGFKNNPEPLNSNPTVKGRFDNIGNTGVVATHQTLLANGKLLLSNQPEYDRGYNRSFSFKN